MSQKRNCRVAVSSFGEDVNSEIAPLSRASYFIIFEGGPEKHKALENKRSSHQSGEMVAKSLVKDKVDIIITGTLGKQSFDVLEKAGIRVHGGCSGKVSDSIKKCLKGELEDCKGAAYSGNIEF